MTLPFLRRQSRIVTLAIDDGPSPVTATLIEKLHRAGHRAVLFVLGENIEKYGEQVLVDAVRRGFALGNHSFSHPFFSKIDLELARTEIARTEVLIESIYKQARVKRHGQWFRFPYLDTGEENFVPLQALLKQFGFAQPEIVGRRVKEWDIGRVDWPTTINTRDWALPPQDEMRETLRQTRPGDVIEFHDKVETAEGYCDLLIEELAALSLTAAVPGARVGLFR